VTIGKGTPEASVKLLAFCRKHGITIGTYLTAAFAFINSKIMVKSFFYQLDSFILFRKSTAKNCDLAWIIIFEIGSHASLEILQ